MAQGMARVGGARPAPAIASREPFVGLPALQGAQLDAGGLAGVNGCGNPRQNGGGTFSGMQFADATA